MKAFLLFLFMFITIITFSQVNPAIQWQKSLGGSYVDGAYDIHQTKDGGYIVASSSYSNDGDVIGNHGSSDYWIVKLDSANNIQWQKSLGGTNMEIVASINQTKDEGYIVAGYSNSNDGDVSGHHGNSFSSDYWIVKLDSVGNIQWQKSLGGTNNDYGKSIQQTKNGGYIVAGYSWSNDGDVSGNHGSADYWIVRLDSTGNIQWQKSLGGTSDEIAGNIQQTKDGGYIITGSSSSNDGDVSGNHGYDDYWIVKLGSTGNVQMQKSLGGSDYDAATNIQQTKDGGYIIAGLSFSNDGDVNGNHGFSDYWILRLNSSGNIQWQKSFGGSNYDNAFSIQQTKDGGYIIVGNTFSNDGDVSGHHGDSYSSDYWIVKLGSAGNIQGQQSLGGTYNEYAGKIEQTRDGGYITAGSSESNDGDVIGHHGSQDWADSWIVKLKSPKTFTDVENTYASENSNAVAEKKSTTALRIQPNPSHNGIFTADLGAIKDNVVISVTDNSGRQVYAKQLSSAQQFTIQLSNKPKGIYYLHVSYDGGEETKKLVIE